MLFILFATALMATFSAIISAHILWPSSLSTEVVAELLVAVGTAALALAATRQLWAWTENRIEDRWPHLRIRVVPANEDGSHGPPHPGGPIMIPEDRMRFMLDNVGPGTATDVWYRMFYRAKGAPKEAFTSETEWYSAAYYMTPKGKDYAYTLLHQAKGSANPAPSLSTLSGLLIEAKCSDLDLKPGDRIVQGLSCMTPDGRWTYMKPETEGLRWEGRTELTQPSVH